MSSTKNTTTFFDDDFEVTYEEEEPFTYSLDVEPVTKDLSNETIVIDTPHYRDDKYPNDRYRDNKYRNNRYDEDIYDRDEDEADIYDKDEYDADIYGGDDYDDDFYVSDSYDDFSRPRRPRRRSVPGIPSLPFPVKKKAKYGTKAIYHVARSVVRIVSFLITAGTLGVLAYNFWRGAAPYGDPQTILTEKNYELAAYAGVAAVFLLFEFIALLWSMTRMKIREGRKVYKEDTGRGLSSFIFLYIASYLSFLLCSFLPDTSGTYAILNGIEGALDVFGSLHNMLLGLCTAGVISCLVRRRMN